MSIKNSVSLYLTALESSSKFNNLDYRNKSIFDSILKLISKHDNNISDDMHENRILFQYEISDFTFKKGDVIKLTMCSLQKNVRDVFKCITGDIEICNFRFNVKRCVENEINMEFNNKRLVVKSNCQVGIYDCKIEYDDILTDIKGTICNDYYLATGNHIDIKDFDISFNYVGISTYFEKHYNKTTRKFNKPYYKNFTFDSISFNNMDVCLQVMSCLLTYGIGTGRKYGFGRIILK